MLLLNFCRFLLLILFFWVLRLFLGFKRVCGYGERFSDLVLFERNLIFIFWKLWEFFLSD